MNFILYRVSYRYPASMAINAHEPHWQATIAVIALVLLAFLMAIMEAFQ